MRPEHSNNAMPRPRRQLVNVDQTPYYHVTARCVRRAFLCGDDTLTRKNYDHRKAWLEQRIRLLSSLFAIDVCAYAVMSNHYHIVLRLNPDSAKNWSLDEVLERWCTLFKGSLLVQKYRTDEQLTLLEHDTVASTAKIYRRRLTDLSWFMKCLNEPIARLANREDKCTGHFWESRFTSQALLSNQALIACMAYVDLNPIRAGIASTPESSPHTSIMERLKPAFNLDQTVAYQLNTHGDQEFRPPDVKPLVAFKEHKSTRANDNERHLPLSLEDYLILLDATVRLTQLRNRGVIPLSLSPILTRLEVSPSDWRQYSTNFEALHRIGTFGRAVSD